jgi:hypothetical protein
MYTLLLDKGLRENLEFKLNAESNIAYRIHTLLSDVIVRLNLDVVLEHQIK